MREVFLAEQIEGVHREVALELFELGRESAAVITRFEAEREVLAVMQHSCIARTLDAGMTHDGRLYFAREYVDGVPITRYCDEHRLDTTERLRLFQRVCDAVQHAHCKAIIHRNLEPSNILVTEEDGRPLPKVVNFGVAKALGHAPLQSTPEADVNLAVVAPAYMSPEQAWLTPEPVDTRADVYSLGVILYELLVGSLPFSLDELRPAGLEGMWRMIREREPAPPSLRLSSLGEAALSVADLRRREVHTLEHEIQGDLDLITLKALEKEPERRYGSVAEFADELRRFLSHEPVQIHSSGRAHRWSRLLRRHRAAFGAAAAFVALLVAGSVGLAVQNGIVADERDRAHSEAKTASAALEFLIDLFGTSHPMEGRGQDVSVGDLLDRGAERLRTELADLPQARAHLLHAIGTAYQGLGDAERARSLLEEALELRRALHDRPHPDLGESLNDVGNWHAERGDLEEAEDYLRQSLAMREATEGPNAHILTEDLSDLALVLIAKGEFTEAEALLQRAIGLDRENAGRVRPDLLDNLAGLKHDSGDLVGAEPLYREALSERERELGPDHPAVANSCNNLGKLLKDSGQYDEAEIWYARALQIRKLQLEPGHPDLAVSANNLGRLREAKGNYTGALELYDESLTIWRSSLGEEHWIPAWVLSNRGVCLMQLGRMDEAGEALREAHVRLVRVLGPDHPRTATSVARQADWLERSGRLEEADRLRAGLREPSGR